MSDRRNGCAAEPEKRLGAGQQGFDENTRTRRVAARRVEPDARQKEAAGGGLVDPRRAETAISDDPAVARHSVRAEREGDLAPGEFLAGSGRQRRGAVRPDLDREN